MPLQSHPLFGDGCEGRAGMSAPSFMQRGGLGAAVLAAVSEPDEASMIHEVTTWTGFAPPAVQAATQSRAG